jgi:hypothetical protein
MISYAISCTISCAYISISNTISVPISYTISYTILDVVWNLIQFWQLVDNGCLNNDRSVLAKSYAWRSAALLPILKGSACAETNDNWVCHRRMERYHSSMDHIIADIDVLCSKDMYLRLCTSEDMYTMYLQRPNNGTGSQLFEINMWMWRYGRTFPKFPRQISVDQAAEFRKKRVQDSRARGAETLRRRHDAAWAKGASSPQ